MPSTAAMQMMFDGTAEETDAEKGLSFSEFRRRSRLEEGLLTVSQAGDVLGVSQSRADQLVRAGTLEAWRFMGRLYVSCAQVAARRASEVKAGRPARTVPQRLKLTAKLLSKTTAAQFLGE
jgi:excisionase family DNA binding protein